jgi:hypothetical protein
LAIIAVIGPQKDKSRLIGSLFADDFLMKKSGNEEQLLKEIE